MKRAICLVVFAISLHSVSAQNEIHKKAVERFIIQFNTDDFEGIYNSFSPSMQRSRTKAYFLNFFTGIKRQNGSLLKMELLEYAENPRGFARGNYDGNFENSLMYVRITVDIRGKITGFYIKRKNLT